MSYNKRSVNLSNFSSKFSDKGKSEESDEEYNPQEDSEGEVRSMDTSSEEQELEEQELEEQELEVEVDAEEEEEEYKESESESDEDEEEEREKQGQKDEAKPLKKRLGPTLQKVAGKSEPKKVRVTDSKRVVSKNGSKVSRTLPFLPSKFASSESDSSSDDIPMPIPMIPQRNPEKRNRSLPPPRSPPSKTSSSKVTSSKVPSRSTCKVSSHRQREEMREVQMEEVEVKDDTETPAERNQRIKMYIKKKDCIIFCRVSTYGQSTKFTISLEVQEEKGNQCAAFFGLKVMGTVKIIESAYNGKACTIKRLIRENRGKNIIIYDASRFCRSVTRGRELLDIALRNKTRLFFVHEGIVWDDRTNRYNENKLINSLRAAQKESEDIGRRVHDAYVEKRRRGFFTGRVAPFGYDIQTVQDGNKLGKKLIPNEKESKIVDFITSCRTVGTSSKTLNKKMFAISGYPDPISLGFKDSKVKAIVEPLSYSEIADLLNVYEVTNRGEEWTSVSVGKVGKRVYDGEVGDVMQTIEKLAFEF